jgi:ADP-heptose:LPS heptosyltransferase
MPNPILKPIELGVRRAFLQMLRLVALFAKKRVQGKSAEEMIASLGDRPSILLLRQDRLGDVLMSTFVIEALRRKYPNSKIAILLGKNNRGAASLLPGNCEFFIYAKNLPQDLAMLRRINRRKFDTAVDLTDNPSVTSSILLSMIGARVTVGVAKQNSISYDITVPALSKRDTHITERVAELLRPFGIDPKTVDRSPRLNIHAQRVSGRVGFNVSSRTEDRSAPVEASASIAQGLIDLGVHEVIVFAAPHERWRGEEVVKRVRDTRVKLAEHTGSFKEFAEQVATCEYLVTVDTSIIQIAAAAGIPMVLLFNPMFETTPWTPVGVPFEIHTQFPGLTSLEPEPVLALFRRLIARNAHTNISAVSA